jgi:hypothetical protein
MEREQGAGHLAVQSPGGDPLRESNWKRSVSWRVATAAARVPTSA